MSKKSLLIFQNIVSGDMSGDITSAVTGIQYKDNISVQLNVVTADAVGTVQVQVSNDYAQDSQGNVSNPGHWVPLVLSGTPTVSSADTDIFINLNQVPAPWIRVFYDATSGSGTMNGFIAAKEI